MKTNDRDFQIPPKITIIKLLFFFSFEGGREMEEDLSERKLLDTRERERERERVRLYRQEGSLCESHSTYKNIF